jgi:cellulose biosynthesis protein BcsQ
MFEIRGVKISELSNITGLAKPTLSARFREKRNGIRKTEQTNRTSEISGGLIQDFFIQRGFEDVFKTTKIQCLSSILGGSGKTSSSLAFLAGSRRIKSNKPTTVGGQKISPACILLDTDPQHSASYSLLGGRVSESTPVLADYFQGKCKLKDLLRPVGDEMYLIPSSLRNIFLEKIIGSSLGTVRNSFKNFFLDLKDHFGEGFFCVVDTAPSLSSVLTSLQIGLAEMNLEKEADCKFVTPIRSADEYGKLGAIYLLEELNENLKDMRLPNSSLPVICFINGYSRASKNSVNVLGQILQEGKLKEHLSPVLVRSSAEIPRAINDRKSVFNGKSKNTASEDYMSLFLECFGIGFEDKAAGNA